MNKNTNEFPLIIMYILALVGVLMNVLNNIQHMWINLLLLLFWILVFTSRNLYFAVIKINTKVIALTYLCEIIILFILSMISTGNSVILLLCITLADCFISCRLRLALLYGGVGFSSYLVHYFYQQQMQSKDFILLLTKVAPIFFLVSLIAHLFGNVIKNKIFIEQSMQAAQVREIELKEAYNKLSEAYENLAEMAVIKERNNIAREIHDTVGHTITTVIVEMEAGRMLSGKNDALAHEKYNMAQSQAQKALEELRRSVRLLISDQVKVNLKQEIISALDETELHTGVKIKKVLSLPEDFAINDNKLIVNIIKESLSNGIRHGGGTAFLLKILIEDQMLHLLLQDNGKGCATIIPGFGLSNMKERITKAGGNIEFFSEEGEGFETRLALPLKRGENYGIN